MTERKTTTPKKAEAAKGDTDKQVAAEHDDGFYGTEVDQTPNENYTFLGQAAGLPTPETDAETKANALRTEEDTADG